MQIKMKERDFKKLLKEIKNKKTTAKKEIENHIMSKKNFTSKQLDKLIELKGWKLEYMNIYVRII